MDHWPNCIAKTFGVSCMSSATGAAHPVFTVGSSFILLTTSKVRLEFDGFWDTRSQQKLVAVSFYNIIILIHRNKLFYAVETRFCSFSKSWPRGQDIIKGLNTGFQSQTLLRTNKKWEQLTLRCRGNGITTHRDNANMERISDHRPHCKENQSFVSLLCCQLE